MPTMTETKALEFAYPAEEGAEPVLALRGVDTAITVLANPPLPNA